MQSTQTPWEMVRKKDSVLIRPSINPSRYTIAILKCPPHGVTADGKEAERDANADLICRAVNSHSDLVGILRRILLNSDRLSESEFQDAVKALEKAGEPC